MENIKIIDLAEKIQKHFKDVEIEKVNIKFQDARNYRVDGSKLKKDFDFVPKYSVNDGIEEVKNLILENRIKDVNDPRYTNQKYLEIFKTKLNID